MDIVPSLSSITAPAVADLAAECVTRDRCDRTIRDYCAILDAIGYSKLVAEKALDKISQVRKANFSELKNLFRNYFLILYFKRNVASDDDWARAYEALVDDNLIHWEIKCGWNKGWGLKEKLKKLRGLQTIDISGMRLSE